MLLVERETRSILPARKIAATKSQKALERTGEAPPPSATGGAVYNPMYDQYSGTRNPDHLLFYRLKDFYEFFFEEAEVAAPLLGIALFTHGKHDGPELEPGHLGYRPIFGFRRP